MAAFKEQYKHVFEEKLIQEIEHYGTQRAFDADTVIIDIGHSIEYMPILISGAIKIMREDKDFHELLLYYLEVGDTCAMTMNCCLHKTKSKIRAIADNQVELIMIPVSFMDSWLIKYKSWRVFVFDSFQTRLDEMLGAIDSLAFQNMEERLYKYLRDKAMVSSDSNIITTHSTIANDLNTSRVVVSRLMKKLEHQNKIVQHRKMVQLVEFL